MAFPMTQSESTISIGEACQVATSPARQLTGGHDERGASIREIARAWAEAANQALELARVSALRTYHRAQRGAVENACRAAYKTQHIATRTQDQARNFQRQYPLRVLGILAGTAFLAGIASRTWRSRAL